MGERKMEQTPSSDAIQRAIEYGVDISLLLENLKRTPTERIERLESVIVFLQEVRSAGRLKRRADAKRSQNID